MAPFQTTVTAIGGDRLLACKSLACMLQTDDVVAGSISSALVAIETYLDGKDEPDETPQSKRKQTSKWADATREFLSQQKGATEFARDWVTANPRRINKMTRDFDTIEKAVTCLRDALSKAIKSPQ